jgi:hypothetical protein
MRRKNNFPAASSSAPERGQRMTRNDIIRLARLAGFSILDDEEVWGCCDNFITKELEQFAALVASHEREACARVCEEIPLPLEPSALTHLPTIERCAYAIRTR